MYKALVRAPLQQVMVLLWLVGAWQLGSWLAVARPDGKWVVTAGAAAFLLMLIGARLRLLILGPVWLALGWAAVMAGAFLMGMDTASGIALITAAYALLAWWAAVRILSSALFSRLVNLLALGGGYSPPGGRFLGERTICWTSLALILLALLIDIRPALPVLGIPAMSWPVLTVALWFLLLSGSRNRLRLNSYLAIVLAMWGIVGLFLAVSESRTSGTAAALPLTELSLGLILALGSALASSAAQWIDRRAERTVDLHALYATPLRATAVGMALLAILQVLILAPELVSPAWKAVAVLALSSILLLLINRELRLPALTVAGALVAGLALCWLNSALVHGYPPWGLRPGGGATGDQWLVVSLLALILATAGYWLEARPTWRQSFGLPLLAVAALVFLWALIGAHDLYAGGSAYLPVIAALLIATLFPLLRPIGIGVEIRGIGVALLSSFFVAAALGPGGRMAFGASACFLWAFALWALGTLVLPRLNEWLRDWSIVPRAWPWLGLLAMGAGIAVAYRPGALQWHLGVVAGVYLFLLLRQSAWPLFGWLAVGALSLGVLLFSLDLYRTALTGLELFAIGMLAVQNLLWANVLLKLVALWERHGPAIAERLRWRNPRLRAPFLFTAFSICTAWLLGILFWDAALVLFDLGSPGERSQALIPGILLALTLLHGLLRWHHPVSAHLFIASVLANALALWGIAQPFHLPLAVALFGVLVAAAWLRTSGREPVVLKLVNDALWLWLTATVSVAVVLLVVVPDIATGEQLLTLALPAASVAYVGWRRRSRIWIYVGALLSTLLLHGLWLIWVPRAHIGSLLPVYALQFALLSWVLRWLVSRLLEREGESGAFMPRLLTDFSRATILLGASEWGLFMIQVGAGVLSGSSMPRLAEPWGHGAAVVAALVLAASCVVKARRSRHEQWVYAAAALAVIVGVYCRLLWVGTAPVSVWDTALIIAAGYVFFALQVLTGSRPTYVLTMSLPLAALFTVPLQHGSTHAGLSLFALGALYALTRRSTGEGTPLYLALLAVNAGIYLWVPDWADRFGVIQVYIVPAALSVLFLAHLHRNELNPAVLSGVRLSALSALYAAAALDVFLQESLWVLALALALSLAGIVLGIVAHVRAFLYAGTAFLVINVLGQLIQLYPEQRLGRALVLMGLGAAVTGAMIWFNLKREAILQRIRIIRADLASWE